MKSAPVKLDQFPLRGGLDLHTPQNSLKPGVARDSLNFECSINGGYTRIPGYERFDGRPSPSGAVYTTLQLTAVAGLAVGDAVNGQTSGATGVVAAVDGLVVVVTKLAGTFLVAENLREGVTVRGVITTSGVLISDQALAATHQLAAYLILRADIGPVPGSGPVRGGFTYNGNVYAWRNNAGGTACVLHRAGVTGWQPIAMSYEVSFTAGSGVAPAEGAIVTQGGVTAVVRRVLIRTGTLGAGTAAGRLVIDAPAGGNFVAGAFTAGFSATASGPAAQSTMLPGGRFEHDIGNAGRGVRVYGCDGVNRGFEFDGTRIIPITTGNTNDQPTHVRVHKNHLFYSFASSAQFSGIGEPYTWTILSGAGELAVDRNITGFLTLPGNSQTAALGVFTEESVHVLYGTSASDWQLIGTAPGVGSKAYAAQALTTTYIYDDLGIVALNAVQEYGNFAPSSLTVNLRSFVQQRKTLVSDSLVNHEKCQYRVFYSDGFALYMTIVNGKLLGAMPVQFPNPVVATWAGPTENGSEISYFGSTDGYVYRNDIGTSFDGQEIDYYFDLAYASQGNVRMSKRYRRAVLELQGDGYAEFRVGYALSYSDPMKLQGDLTEVQASTAPSYWDLFTWDMFTWDGRAIAPEQVRLEGTAENISLRIEGRSALWPSFTVNSMTIHYTPRRILRN
jgi:hypothetical protein